MPPVCGAAIVAVLISRLGGQAVVDALRVTDAGALVQGGAAGVVIVAVTTACGAWRWQLVARRLHVELSLADAFVGCYRSQFLNVALPGGVLGDLARGVHHGRAVDDLERGLRVVAWERAAGQVVLAAVALPVLLVTRPFPRLSVGVTAWGLLVAALLVLGVVWPRLGRRLVHSVAGDARALRHPAALAGMLLASLATVAGHLATFVLAARAVGVDVPLTRLLPLALVVLLVAAVPLNLAGWGPREGAAAWVFAASGMDPARGLAVSVAFGAIVFVAILPGAVLLLARRSRRPAHG